MAKSKIGKGGKLWGKRVETPGWGERVETLEEIIETLGETWENTMGNMRKHHGKWGKH